MSQAHAIAGSPPSSSIPRRILGAFLAVLLLGASLVGLGGRAEALPPGITDVHLTLGGEEYNGVGVVEPGQKLKLTVQYGLDVVGTTATFAFGEAVEVPNLPNNEAIERVEQDDDGNLVITFKDSMSNNQGVFTIELEVKEVEHSSHETITWEVDGEESSTNVIVKKPGDQFENVTEGFAKNVSPGNLNGYVSIDDGNVVVDEGILSEELSYTLQLNSPEARDNFTIADTLPAGLEYLEDSFEANITTWDENGLNKDSRTFEFDPNFEGNTFEFSGDIPGPSELTVSYKANLTEEALSDLRADLQDAYKELEGKPGSYNVGFTNTVIFGDTERQATVNVGGYIQAPPGPAGPEPWNAFSKLGSWGEQVLPNGVTDEDGTLQEPLEITYTLKTDLSRLKGESDFELKSNVIVEDTLPEQLSWKAGAPDFITVTDDASNELTLSNDCPSAEDFADDDYVGQYCVDGDTLRINVGNEDTGISSIDVLAQVDTVDGMDTGWHPTEGAEAWGFRNTASFHWNDEPHNDDHGASIVILPESGDDGHYDETRFTKSGPGETISANQGDTLEISYKFTVMQGTDYDVTKSHIVDHVDWEIFDRGVDPTVSGSYNWQDLDADDFEITENDDGHLVIALSDAGKEKVGDDVNRQWEMNITLTSLPFDGKETKEMKNKAVLFGSDEDAKYWSETYAESTSYGDEAEVRKRVYNRADAEWVETLDAQLDAEGELIESTFVYRVEFIPHGSYDNVRIVDVEDLLPEEVEFLGFVAEEDAATGENPQQGPVDIGGNLEAVYNDGMVTLQQQEGTRLQAGNPIAAFFAVELLSTDAPVTNAIGNTEATIVPVPGPSIDIEKWSDEGEDSGPRYDDDGALNNDGYDGDYDDDHKELTAGEDQEIRFTVSNDGGEALTDIVVIDATAEGTHGDIENLVCTFPDETTGTEWDGPFEPATQFECTGTLPGLEAGQTHTDTATVVGTGVSSGDEVTDSDDWNAKVNSYAIGDYVWIDSDRDGIQGEGEDPLAGVTVELLNEEGDVEDSTVTDDEGRYLFDNLPAGKYRVKFTLTEEQSAKYQFTDALVGDDVGVDSDADVQTGLTGWIMLDDSNGFLTTDYDRDVAATEGIDPTWDAGVVLVEDEQVPPQPVDPVDPNEPTEPDAPESPEGELPSLGASIGLVAAALTLLAMGAWMVSRRDANAAS